MACGRVRRPYVRTSHYMTFLYEGIGVRAGGAGGGAVASPVAKIFGQNACDSGKGTWDKIFID